MGRAIDSLPSFFPSGRADWREWLQQHHDHSSGVWLIYFKKAAGRSSLSYNEIVEEALCFGWIDSLHRKRDHETAMLLITPRKPKSVWSQLNKQRVEQLIAAGLMTEAGSKSICTAKVNGSWNSLDASNLAAESNRLPPELKKALQANKVAAKHFRKFSLSVRRQFLSWILSAKTDATKQKRIGITVEMSSVNKKPGPQGFKIETNS
jgi:uncharacterized protein YdeI (YjbR/CyaY-like superfamily)